MVGEIEPVGRSRVIPVEDRRIARVVTLEAGSWPNRVSYRFDALRRECQRLVGIGLPEWVVQNLGLDILCWQRVRAPGDLRDTSVDNFPRLFIGAPHPTDDEIEEILGRRPRAIPLSEATATIVIPDPSEERKRLEVTGIDNQGDVQRFRYAAEEQSWSVLIGGQWRQIT